jgi:hypothetical protein
VDAAFKDAVASGQASGAAWRAACPGASVADYDKATLASLGRPPDAAGQSAELVLMHQVADARTAQLNGTAMFYEQHASHGAWMGYLQQIASGQGMARAQAVEQAMSDAVKRAGTLSEVERADVGRLRPFEVDPTLTTVVPRPTGNPSFPSGHATAAFAAALVLAKALPQERDELLAEAEQAAWSRVYGGVHFPSDVVAAARLAARTVVDMPAPV